MNGIHALLCLLAFSWLETASAEDLLDYQRRIDALALNGLIVDPEASEKDVVSQLGKPTKKHERRIHNAYYDFEDRILSYEYPGLKVVFYQFTHPSKGWTKVAQIRVTASRWPSSEGLTVGMAKDAVKNILGPPHRESQEKDDTSWYYFPTDEVHRQVICVFTNGMLTEVVWSDMP